MPKLAQLPTPERPAGNGRSPPAAAAAEAATVASDGATRRREVGNKQAEQKKHARIAAKTQQLAEGQGIATQELLFWWSMLGRLCVRAWGGRRISRWPWRLRAPTQ